MQVREIMTKNPACCTPDSNLEEVAKLMVDHDCGCIPVVDSHLGMKPIGTITDRDITIRTVAAGQNPVKMKASEIMTTDIVTINPETTVQECGNVMKKADIRRVLVVDRSGKCCGIVAQADIAQYGPNPNLISDVVNEISQSAPSTNVPVSKEGRNDKTFSFKKSLLDFNTLLPLVAGIGAGAALKYYFSPEKEADKSSRVKKSFNPPVNKNPDRFDKMASNLSHQETPFKTEVSDVNPKNVSSFDREDESTTNPEIGRSAGHN